MISDNLVTILMKFDNQMYFLSNVFSIKHIKSLNKFNDLKIISNNIYNNIL